VRVLIHRQLAGADRRLLVGLHRAAEDRLQARDDLVEAEGLGHLSPTEFKLLRYLMLNPNRVLSKAQILDHVWEYDFTPVTVGAPVRSGRLAGLQHVAEAALGLDERLGSVRVVVA
jgi:DNA-binding response OmpR family regulator